MKNFRRDLWSILSVMAVVMMVAAVFPYASLRFRALPHPPSPPAAAFMTLTDAEESEALRVAKTAWQIDPSGLRRLRIALAVGELPEYPHGPVAPLPSAGARGTDEFFHYTLKAYPATRGAPPPSQIHAPPPVSRACPFSKTELLKTVVPVVDGP